MSKSLVISYSIAHFLYTKILLYDIDIRLTQEKSFFFRIRYESYKKFYSDVSKLEQNIAKPITYTFEYIPEYYIV